MYNNYSYNNPFLTPSNQYGQYNSSSAWALKGRPVSSLEEVRAAQIDFDGSLFLFPDVANKKIYTKQINLDGTSSLKVYSLIEAPAPVEYVTRQELNATIEEMRQSLLSLKEISDGTDKSKSKSSGGTESITF